MKRKFPRSPANMHVRRYFWRHPPCRKSFKLMRIHLAIAWNVVGRPR